jgi:2-polyprenyl-6-methoxyphenol hydroxylase-like FAD-dependent oxidoreductase
MLSASKRAVIIGGGIGGVSAAIALRRVGLEVEVFERAPELKEVGAGITLWSNAVRALRHIGVGDELAAVSTPLDRSQIRTWRGKVLSEVSLGEVGRKIGAPSIGIHRADLLDVLVRAVPCHLIRLGATCVGFEQDAGTVTARFADSSRATGDLLIGADGLRSQVREQVLGAQKPRYGGYGAWRGVARFEHPDYPPGLTALSIGRGSEVGMLPIGKGRTYWFASINRPEGRPAAAGGHKSEALDMLRRWHSPIPALIEATDASAILYNDICDREPVRRWGEGRVTLMGDAAHPTTPHLGQGACQAIEDAVVIARRLAQLVDGGDVAGTLRAYEAERYDRTAAIVYDSRKLGKMLRLRNPVACWLRNTLLRLTPHSRMERDFMRHLEFRVE